MKRIPLTTILAITLFMVGTAAAASWSKEVKIKSIQVSNVTVPGVWLTFDSAPYTSHTCKVNSGEWMLGGGPDNVNKMTTIATEALVNSRNVSVYWGGHCSPHGYPILIGLTLK